MLFDFLLFPLFLAVIYVLGAGALRLSHYKTTIDYPDYFYPVFGLLTLGFVSVVINFYSGVAAPITVYILAGIAAFGVYHIKKTGVASLQTMLLFALFLTPMAAMMRAGYDTGLYHLPHQQWIRDEKIIFGLANFQDSLGFSSLIEYISAPLWVGEHFKLLAYAQTCFMFVLLLFIRSLTRSSHGLSSVIGLLLGVSAFLYIIILKPDYTSTDIPMAVMFVVCFYYGLHLLLRPNTITQQNLTILFVTGLFTATLKTNGLLIVLWVTFVAFLLLRNKQLNWKTLFHASVLPAVLSFIWLTRGIIVSGCLAFPVAQTCFSLPWAAGYNAQDAANSITVWARQPGVGLAPLHSWEWFSAWWVYVYAGFIAYMIAMCIIVGAGYRYLCRITTYNQLAVIVPAFLFIILNIVVWFLKAPTPRFGIGFFIALPPIVALLCFGVRQAINSDIIAKASKICLYLLLVELAVVGYIKGNRQFAFNSFVAPEIAVVSHMNFGVRPVEGDQCWLVKYCSPHDRPPLIEYNDIRMFPTIKVDYD